MMVCYIWEFNVLEDHVDDFIKGYQTDGEWCKFYIKSDEFIKTEFYSDKNNPCRFVTIDFWKSSEALEKFKAANKEEYDKLDMKFEDITDIEVFVGEFNIDQQKADSMNFYDVFN